jgi:uncharacterized protein YjdB
MLDSEMLTADVIPETITGKNVPLVSPEKVTSVVLPTGLTVIVVLSSGSITAPIYIAAELILSSGKEATVPTFVAKSG